MMKCMFFFLLSSNLHIKLHFKALFAKPMFKINKPLLIPKNMQVMWQNIPCHVMKCFATSSKVCQMENKYIKNIP